MGRYELDFEMNSTMRRIMEYLEEELRDGAKFISYTKIGKEVRKSRHTVAYSIEKLKLMGKITIIDGKLSL